LKETFAESDPTELEFRGQRQPDPSSSSVNLRPHQRKFDPSYGSALFKIPTDGAWAYGNHANNSESELNWATKL
jgi:hypothetical protein